jgi:hypothetical protein
MTALSDQSSMGLWPAWAWWALAWLCAAVVLAAGIGRTIELRDRQRPLPHPIRRPWHADEPCHTAVCTYPAVIAVRLTNGDTAQVCAGCYDRGTVYGWFSAA